MENTIDYTKTLAEAKRLKMLNEIVMNEIFEKADAFEKSLTEIKSQPTPKMSVTKTCKCVECKRGRPRFSILV
jgi:hypothetical protein